MASVRPKCGKDQKGIPPNVERYLLNERDLNDSQKERLTEWIITKREMGDITHGKDLEKISDLGYGNHGVVWKVKHKPSGMLMARKLLYSEMKHSLRNQIIKELKSLHYCNSPYIVVFFGAFYSERKISICTEYMDGLSLDILTKRTGGAPEPILGRVSLAILNGLQYLKDRLQILHRDVKPSNILANTRGEIKLCDCGVSRQLINTLAFSFVGSKSYISPECLKGSRYSSQSDVWSFGLTLIELVICRYPIPYPTVDEYAKIFNKNPEEIVLHGSSTDDSMSGNTNVSSSSPTEKEGPRTLSLFEMLDYIVEKPPPSLPRDSFTVEFLDFLYQCLRKLPEERSDLKTLLKHSFIEKSEKEEFDFVGWMKNASKEDEKVL